MCICLAPPELSGAKDIVSSVMLSEYPLIILAPSILEVERNRNLLAIQ